MKILTCRTDGGPNSTVTGFWLIEIKGLFSIVFLKFNKGSREAYHSHAFNAFTWFLKGKVDEDILGGPILRWLPSFKAKFTPRSNFHKVFALEDTYALSFRGPWTKTWQEYIPKTKEFHTLTHGRTIIKREKRLY